MVKKINKSYQEKEGRLIDVGFDFLLILKSLFALGEVISGIAMFFITPARMQGIIVWFVKGGIRAEHRSFIANALVHFGQNFTEGTQFLVAIYLLGHGLIKLVTLALLWRKVLWAYPLSIILFIGFIIYQMFEFASHHSIMMLLVTLLDIVMIVLTWLEYQKMRGKWGTE